MNFTTRDKPLKTFSKKPKIPFMREKCLRNFSGVTKPIFLWLPLPITLFRSLKKHLPARFKRASLETVTDCLVSHGGQLVPKDDKSWIIRMNRNFLYIKEAKAILNSIRKKAYFLYWLKILAKKDN